MYPDAAQLAVLRADAAQALGDMCKVGGMRGSPRAMNTSVYAAMPCLIRVIAPTQGIGGTSELNMEPSRFALVYPYTYELERGDTITHNGESYFVADVLDDQSPMIFRSVELQRTVFP